MNANRAVCFQGARILAAFAVFFAAAIPAGNAQPAPGLQAGGQIQVCRGGACFESWKNAEDQELRLSGIAKRAYLWMDIYSAALYLPPAVKTATRGVPDGPKIMVLEYHRSVEKAKIIESIVENVESNEAVDKQKVRSRLAQLTEVLEAPGEGDRYEFQFIPGKGTAVWKDGAMKTLIPGDDFAFAFFGIWLYENTGDAARRRQLLGLE